MLRSIAYHGDHVRILDQQRLPHDTVYVHCTTTAEVWECIKALKVRGAPAIGMAAAFALAVWANRTSTTNLTDFLASLRRERDYLASSRPTAVNLFWALDRVVARAATATDVAEARQLIENEALAIQKEDEDVCRRIGEHALSLMNDGDTILTICNAGAIATARYGTALAPLYLAKERDIHLSAYACETRPLLQGSRLTAWELQQAGVDVTLISDSMAAHTLATKPISAVIVGCDRVAANGDTANKIGTLGLAILAKEFGVPFYVAAPLSTIDLETATGDAIPIEERAPEEITHFHGHPVAPSGTNVFNPAFDVTPHRYISAIITEKGIVRDNYQEALAKLKQSEPALK